MSFAIDSLADLANVPAQDFDLGTRAYVILEGAYYYLALGTTGAVPAKDVEGMFWLAEVQAKQGDDLGDADTTVIPGHGASQFTLDDGTLTANGSVTLSDTGHEDGLLCQIVRRDLSAFDYVVFDHDGTTTLYTFAGGTAPKAATFVYSEADGVWKLANVLYVA